MPHDPLLPRLTSAFREVPGVAAIVLGGSRARTNDVWRLLGDGALAPACEALRQIERQLQTLCH